MIERTADILMVEDSAEDAELAMRALKARELGNNVVHLLDGDEALDFVWSSSVAGHWKAENVPRVIFLDLKLTRIGGLEVLRQLKGEERTRSIPVVIFTASRDEKEMMESYQLGVNSYVVKPHDAREFARLVGDIAHYWLTVNCPFYHP